MKTLAALKRALVAGTTLKVLDHSRKELIGTVRTVRLVQGNGYWFTQPDDPPDKPKWWANFPPAADVTFHDDGSFTFLLGNGSFSRLQICV